MSDIGKINSIGSGYGAQQISGTPLLGQTGGASLRAGGAESATAAPAVKGDSSSFSPELGESEGQANALLAAWGTSSAAQAPPLSLQGVKPGAQPGFVSSAGQLGGVEPGMQAGGVMMGPVLR